MTSELIIALDYPTEDEAMALVDAVGSSVQWVKVGLELFLNSGGHIIDALKARNLKIFLDLKFHDIANTVAAACYWAGGLGVDMMNVHALGGYDMMAAAREAANAGALAANKRTPALIAVTILTGLQDHRLEEMGIATPVAEEVRRLAQLAHRAGLDGVVSSPREAALIRETTDSTFLTVCPGIRPIWSASNDQKRIMTPAEAQAEGVSHMVIGRPVNKAADPAVAVQRILAELKA